MPEITPLLCSSCGGALKATTEHDRFVCSRCSNEYLVERGIPHLSATQVAAKPPPMPKRDTTEVLLKLFERIPDSKQLDILLEPANLLRLLMLYGWREPDLRQQLSNGKVPGELLLELLDREPDPEKLLARLGKSMPPAGLQTAAAKIATTKIAAPHTGTLSARLAGIIYILFGLALAAVAVIWYLVNPDQVSAFQITLCCLAPILAVLGAYQLITKRSLRR
jgi:hypothetical protein